MAGQNYSPTVRQVHTQIFHYAGLTTVDLVAMIKFRAPTHMQVERFSATARVKSGTHLASVFDLLDDGVTVLAAAGLDFASTAGDAGARVTATLAAGAARIAAGSEVTINFTETGGTTPVLTDIDLQIDWVALD